ncbi:isopenicillin N synthase family oxygenase [Phyllobacterium sp. 628]|uniref:isopenicillin N synthase family dioxygenase n=1 Tax=Phyllobacterium sp. 628 TaxID=2718938 RepID=UPI0016626786|nr:isopenicillin N synthase family oxygenase [Phyllobacterium sp. 628]QND51044.1 isopenicillin N synthase family oxygenase [Phyllobacterium sp. 628]
MSALPKTDSLPTLDFARYRNPAEREDFFEDLRHAARTYGFFYLSGHGVSDQLQKDIVAISKRFFALPQADKVAVEMVHSPHFRGYTRAGGERTRGQADWREQFDVGTERRTVVQNAATPWTRLQGPNQWPDALPDLKSVVLDWQSELTRVAIELLQAFATALGQDKDVFKPIYENAPNQHLKIIRYPGRDATGSDQGVGAHKDSGFLTLLLQDVQGGLQVEKDGGWIDATPVPGTFVINIGEILELASDGYLKATVHRVVTPPSGKDRLSVAFFFGADLNADVPLLKLPSGLAQEAGGTDTDPDNPLFREVGRNYLKGRLRSHPDVAQRHHADLL